MSNATATPARAEAAQPSTSAAVLFGDLTYVRKVSAAIGVTPQMLPESAVQEINNNVTYLLRNVIAGSLRFAAHSRRNRLIPEDVDAHLALERKPAQYGFKPRDFVALRLAGCGGKEVFVEEDQEIELKSIYTASAPKIPPLPYIKAHWLAIDGEQPAVPENPVPPPAGPAYGRAETSHSVDDAQHTQEDANRLLNMVRGGKVTEQVNVKTTTTHTLSLEQQVYYKEITEAIMGSDDIKRTEALHSLRTDAGLQPLLSRFSIAIAEGVRCNIVQHNLAFLIYLMRMLQSLVNNPSISLDKCLHEMLPAILSCILSRQVCARPESDNHWALREFAGRLLADVCKKHHAMDVQTRIIDVLQQVWTKSAPPVGTVYGSLYALNEFGLETIRCVVVPHIPSLHSRLQTVVADRSDPGERLAAERTMTFATKVMISYVRQMRPTNLSTFQDYQDLLGGFADPVYRVVAMEIPQTTRTLAATRTQVRHAEELSAHRLAPQQQQQAPRILQQRQGTSSGYSTPVQSRSGTPVSRQVISNSAQVRYTTSNPGAVRRPLTNQQQPSTVPRPPQ